MINYVWREMPTDFRRCMNVEGFCSFPGSPFCYPCRKEAGRNEYQPNNPHVLGVTPVDALLSFPAKVPQ